jgi:acyl-CoA synthetase (NDP forming)
MNADSRDALRVGLAPKSIAVIGASENSNKIGGRPLAYLSRFGYRGAIYPINPTRSEVQGIPSFDKLQALPEVPEMAIVAVAGEMAMAAVDECARAGVKIAVVMSSGFGETDAEGKRREVEMVNSAKPFGMRIVGPNSQGLANFGTGAIASFSTMFIEAPPSDGPVGIISQSGAMSVIPYGLLRGRGIGVRHAHATGNDCDVTVCELATIVAEDPDLRLLLLYLEGIPDPWNLAEAARVARERDLPIVVLKSGRTAAGQEAARSHTGSLASEDRVVDAFLRDHGIMRVNSMAEMVASAELYLKGWRPQGRRLVTISNSGAVCVLAADAATAAGMPMEPLSSDTQAELRGILPGFATTVNPVDITAALLTNSGLLGGILPALARDPAADAFLVGIAVAGAGYDVERFARDSAAFAEVTGKPLVVAAPQESVANRFKGQGLAVFPTEGEAIGALGQFLSHAELRVAAKARGAVIPAPDARAEAPSEMLDEAASLALLGARGLPVVSHRLCQDEAGAIAAFEALGGGAVVLKGCSAAVAHKSELGLVKVGLRDRESVARAWREIMAAAKAAGVELSSVIVASLVRGQRELMIGARVDPVFGVVLLVGDGGKYVELMPDSQVLLAPFDRASVEAGLRRLRIAPLLDGARGDPPLDVAAFCDAAVRVGELMLDRREGLTNLDINPVIVGAQGEGCVAVDAVIYRCKNQ